MHQDFAVRTPAHALFIAFAEQLAVLIPVSETERALIDLHIHCPSGNQVIVAAVLRCEGFRVHCLILNRKRIIFAVKTFAGFAPNFQCAGGNRFNANRCIVTFENQLIVAGVLHRKDIANIGPFGLLERDIVDIHSTAIIAVFDQVNDICPFLQLDGNRAVFPLFPAAKVAETDLLCTTIDGACQFLRITIILTVCISYHHGISAGFRGFYGEANARTDIFKPCRKTFSGIPLVIRHDFVVIQGLCIFGFIHICQTDAIQLDITACVPFLERKGNGIFSSLKRHVFRLRAPCVPIDHL